MDGALPHDDIFAHDAWRHARRCVLDAAPAGNGAGPLVLLGPAGSGKTLLLRRLANALRKHGSRVRVADGAIPASAHDGDVLLIDGADRLDDSALTGLRRRGGACVLAARPDFADRLAALKIPGRTVPLGPMTAAEVATFVRAQLVQIGVTPKEPNDDAIARLIHWSGGFPGPLTQLIAALYAENDPEPPLAPPPTAAIVPAPTADPRAPLRPPPMQDARDPMRRFGAPAAVLLLAIIASAAVLHGARPRMRPILPPPRQIVDSRPIGAASVQPPPPVRIAAALSPVAQHVSAVPPAPPTLPVEAPLSVDLAYASTDPDGQNRAEVLGRTLTASGIAVTPPTALAPAAASPGIRYFFAEDRAAALAVARLADPSGATPATLGRAGPVTNPGAILVVLPYRARVAGR